MERRNKESDEIMTIVENHKKPRIIRPSKNFLWKNYFLMGLVFLVFTFIFIIIFGAIYAFMISINPSREAIVKDFISLMYFLYFGGWFLVLLAYIIGMYFYVKSMKFIVHGDEIVAKRGLFTISEKHVPYRTVTNIDMRAGPFDRLFSIGTIEIQTAGGRGRTIEETAEEKLEGIKVYKEVRDYILTQLRQFKITDQSDQRDHDSDVGIPKEEQSMDFINELREIKGLLKDKLVSMEEKIDKLNKNIENQGKPY